MEPAEDFPSLRKGVIGFIIGGAITVESVFSWPGLGQLTYQALRGPDVPLLQAIFLLISVGVVVAKPHR